MSAMQHEDASVADGGVLLAGLDGSNPLGFMAALGTLRALSLYWAGQDVRMSWRDSGDCWKPVIATNQSHKLDCEDVLDALGKCLAHELDCHPINVLTEIPPRVELASLTSTIGVSDRAHSSIDWLSSLASELAPDAVSQLQTVRRDYFIGNLRSIIQGCDKASLERSLFRPWSYSDPLDNQSLHLDPTEDRRHAYQWDKPSGDPNRKKRGGMLGANRLAIEAFPMFQSLPNGAKLITRGFTGTRSSDTRWTWPIWSKATTCKVVESLLSLADLQSESPDMCVLRSQGVEVVFRTQRILVEKTPNFTPAVAIL